MKVIESVTGTVALEDLGRTLIHEHIFVTTPEVQAQVREFDASVEIPAAVARLDQLADLGIDTIIDPTVIGLGRDIAAMSEVASMTKVKVIAATGIYTFAQMPGYFRFRSRRGPRLGLDPITELMIDEITVGIAGTGIRAAVIKCATDVQGLTDDVERILRASARAHLATSAPIITHTDARTERGRDQMRIFTEEGVDPGKIVIGHCGDTEDLTYLQELLDMGCTLGMDRFGVNTILPFENRVAVVAELCRRGYAAQLALAHDAACYIDWFAGGHPDTVLPQWNYTHIPLEVIPRLRELGVSDGAIETMLVTVPAALFA